MFTTLCAIVAQTVQCSADIIFVLDASNSVGSSANFNKVKSFVSQLVGRLDIDSGNTRVGVLTYADGIEDRIDLNDHTSVSSLQTAVSGLSYSGDSETNTHKALARVRKKMLTAGSGDRVNVDNVVILITAGPSEDEDKTKVSIIELESL